MGRHRNPISNSGPIGKFAQQLRDLVDEVPGRAFRTVADAGHCSFSLVAKACAGEVLPTFDTVEAIVRGCGGTDDDITDWRAKYVATQQTSGQLMRKLGDAAVVVPTHTDTGQPIRTGRLRAVQSDVADPASMVPNPVAVQTFDDLIYHAKVLRIRAGNPSFRELAKTIKAIASAAKAANIANRITVSASAMSDIFAGHRPPTSDQFISIVAGLLQAGQISPGQDTRWSLLSTWREAWQRAEFNRERPDLGRRRRLGKTYLLAEDKDEGPSVSVIAEMAPAAAAALLSSLPAHIAAGILGELPPAKQQAVFMAMHELDNAAKNNGGATKTADGTVLPMRPKKVPETEGGFRIETEPPE